MAVSVNHFLGSDMDEQIWSYHDWMMFSKLIASLTIFVNEAARGKIIVYLQQ